MDIEAVVNEKVGINFVLRNKMRAAFKSEDNEGPKLAALIVLTKEVFIKPEVRELLKKLWADNFNGKIEDVAQTAPAELLDWIASTE